MNFMTENSFDKASLVIHFPSGEFCKYKYIYNQFSMKVEQMPLYYNVNFEPICL